MVVVVMMGGGRGLTSGGRQEAEEGRLGEARRRGGDETGDRRQGWGRGQTKVNEMWT